VCQAAAVLRRGLGIVVSPLPALERDQLEAASTLGLRAAALNSSISQGERDALLASLDDLDLVFLAPERWPTTESSTRPSRDRTRLV
jgi:ATP-dependent DNA helicase RecQ